MERKNMADENLTLRENIARLQRDNRELEENYQMVMSPSGKIGSQIINLDKRIRAIEQEQVKIAKSVLAIQQAIQAKQNKASK